MPTFAAHDGTSLAYSTIGEGEPVLCLPGGPMQDARYLGDLGGLPRHRALALLDPRGTGDSAAPTDPATYRCDRQVDDVEALRLHLDLDRIDLLAHSAGVNLAVLYAARHPGRVRRLALITPSARALGVTVDGDVRRSTAQLRSAEPWFPDAYAALQRITVDEGTDDDWEAIAPFSYGRWDDAARAHYVAGNEARNDEAAMLFGSDGAFDPESTHRALCELSAPVLLLFGEVDLNSPAAVAPDFARLFTEPQVVVQPHAGHMPWLDDADAFVTTVNAFLA